MKKNLSVIVCQMTSTDDVEANYLQIEQLIQSIPQSADLALFPENCLYMRLLEGQAIPGLDFQHPIFQKLGNLAQSKKIALHLGSIPLREDGKLTNASAIVKANGEIKATYRKMHLFDITLEGQAAIRESDVFNHGPNPSVLEVQDWHLGQTICYDVRFSELFSVYAKQTVDAILVPSAFLVKTGQAHWEVLLRARAIESQCYVIAAAQAGTHLSSHGGQRKTYGHSMVINPWGEILFKGSSDRPEAHFIELESTVIESVRRQIPMNSHRRL
ncbi:MAG: carbon-nitrogen hydrolase family protein [Pseudobdellovibrionaceae bacterium]